MKNAQNKIFSLMGREKLFWTTFHFNSQETTDLTVEQPNNEKIKQNFCSALFFIIKKKFSSLFLFFFCWVKEKIIIFRREFQFLWKIFSWRATTTHSENFFLFLGRENQKQKKICLLLKNKKETKKNWGKP